MSGRLAALAARRAWLPPAIGVALLVGALALARGVSGELGVGSLALGDRQAGATGVVLVRTTASPGTGERVAAVAFGVIRAQLESDPHVAAVRVAGGGEDGRTRVLSVTLASGDEGERQQVAGELTGTIDPGPLRVSIEGEALALASERDRLGGELWKLELLALPVVLLLLGWGLGVRAGLAAAGAAALAIVGVPALLRVADLFADVSLLGAAAGAPVGMVAAIELTRLRVQRHREALAIWAGDEAPVLAGAEWLRPALAFVVTASIAPLALLLTPLAQAGSLALGCAAGAAGAAVGVALFGVAALPAGSGVRPMRTPLAARAARWLARRRMGLAATLLLVFLLVGVLAVLGQDVHTRGVGEKALGESLTSDLPLAALVAALATGTLVVVVTRSARVFPLGLGAVLAAAAVSGLAAFFFVQSRRGSDFRLGASFEHTLASHLGLEHVNQLETAALAAALAALVAICAARSALAALAVAAERRVDASPDTAAERAATALFPGVAIASICAAIGAAVLTAADSASAQQFGFLIASGLLLDAAVVRLPTVALASRLIRPRRQHLEA